MNFIRRIVHAADITLLLLLMMQIYEINVMTGNWPADDLQEGEPGTEESAGGNDFGIQTASDADTASETVAGSDGLAAVSFAEKEELNAETAAAIEDVREITVLITNKGEGGYCHSTLSFSFAADVVLTTRSGVTYLDAGETLELVAEDYTVGESLRMEKAANVSDTSKEPVFAVDFSTESGSDDVRTYAGTLEITVTEDGFLLRNTLALEEYLRYVVPAEMTASYPEEALKAQAICARTYALRSAGSGVFAKYGADISDDTSCQVYNTQGTDERTDAAVLSTAGEFLVYDGGAAECYYFSTSCGVTTDAAIWGEEIPWLKSVAVSWLETGTGEESEITGESEIGELLREEEYLRSFLDDGSSGAESGEAWYRWKASFSLDDLAARLSGEIGAVLALEVTQRGSGGVAVELAVYGSNGQKVIESQYAIRQFFCLGDGTTCVRQDGTEVSDSMLLPSAFFYIQMEADGTVTLVGGGFGHGCGMSQNAAKAYASEGADACEILSFFYSGTKIYREGN